MWDDMGTYYEPQAIWVPSPDFRPQAILEEEEDEWERQLKIPPAPRGE